MRAPVVPVDETARLRSLHRLGILDSAPDVAFDHFTRLAAKRFAVPVAAVSFIDQDRQWLMSRQGIAQQETSRAESFCGHTILADDTLIVTDSLEDPRFAQNPAVLMEGGLRFYAGHSLRAPDGHRIGALCIADSRPRDLSLNERDLLRRLAREVEGEIRRFAVLNLDPVTGLTNEPGFQRRAARALAVCREHREMASVLMLDLLAPDDAQFRGFRADQLRPFADLLSDCLPAAGFAAHRGEGRFMAFAPRCNVKDMQDGLERLAHRFRLSSLALARPRFAWRVGTVALRRDADMDLGRSLAMAERQMLLAPEIDPK